MKKIAIVLLSCCALIACKKNDVRFTYSPESPKAGESVSFSNLSSTGEEWAWTFGDGISSAVRNPSHVFKQPGRYRVMLKVDNNNSWVYTKEITVYDTIPTFVSSDTVFEIFKDYTFTAMLYNPYQYPVTYEWTTGEDAVVVSEEEGVLKCYFTQPDDSTEIGLKLTWNGTEMEIKRKFFIKDKATHSVLLRTAEGDFRVRIFGERAETAKEDESAAELLDEEDDSQQEYNGYLFTLADLDEVFPGVEGFRIANRKIYYRLNGLWVATIRGTDIVPIDERPCAYMTLDTKDNRIYWANEEGVWYMPFVGSDNNKFVTVPEQLMDWSNVTKIAVDGEAQ